MDLKLLKEKYMLVLMGMIVMLLICPVSKGETPNRGIRTLNMIDEIISSTITSDMSDYEKALALHDWLIDNVDYYATSLSSFHADSALLNRYGVCQSYSEAYALLLNKAGVNCKCVETSFHEWNLAELDGAWYHIDVTWDDTSGNRHLYFAIPDFAIRGVEHHGSSGDCYSYQNNYAYKNGFLTLLIDNNQSLIQQKLDEGKTKFTMNVNGSISGDLYDVMKKTAMVAVSDQKYIVNGKAKRIRITPTTNNGELDFEIDANEEPDAPATATGIGSPYGGARIYVYDLYNCLDTRIDWEGGTGASVYYLQIRNQDGDVLIDIGGGSAYYKTNFYLPDGEYDVTIFFTDGKVDKKEEYHYDLFGIRRHWVPYLPSSVIEIQDQAFMNDTSLGPQFECNEGLKKIGKEAFAGSYVRYIYIPKSVTEIDPKAFSGIENGLIIIGYPGTEAERFAKEANICFNEDWM